MATIVALDLGKFNTVACFYEGEGAAAFDTPAQPRREAGAADAAAVRCVVFEACPVAGWVYELCQELGQRTDVANWSGLCGCVPNCADSHTLPPRLSARNIPHFC